MSTILRTIGAVDVFDPSISGVDPVTKDGLAYEDATAVTIQAKAAATEGVHLIVGSYSEWARSMSAISGMPLPADRALSAVGRVLVTPIGPSYSPYYFGIQTDLGFAPTPAQVAAAAAFPAGPNDGVSGLVAQTVGDSRFASSSALELDLNLEPGDSGRLVSWLYVPVSSAAYLSPAVVRVRIGRGVYPNGTITVSAGWARGSADYVGPVLPEPSVRTVDVAPGGVVDVDVSLPAVPPARATSATGGTRPVRCVRLASPCV